MTFMVIITLLSSCSYCTEGVSAGRRAPVGGRAVRRAAGSCVGGVPELGALSTVFCVQLTSPTLARPEEELSLLLASRAESAWYPGPNSVGVVVCARHL